MAGRRCKCKSCGKELNTLNAYRSENDNRYYCSENEYLKYVKEIELQKKIKEKELQKRIEEKENQKRIKEKENQDKKETINFIYFILGEKITSSIFFKEYEEVNSLYKSKIIYSYLSENEQMLNKIMNKSFASQFAKIRYFFAILKNNLPDYVIEEDDPIRIIDYEEIQQKYKNKKVRRALIDIEKEVGGE